MDSTDTEKFLSFHVDSAEERPLNRAHDTQSQAHSTDTCPMARAAARLPDGTSVYRYMSFRNFQQLVVDRKSWFSSIPNLQAHADRREGTLALSDATFLSQMRGAGAIMSPSINQFVAQCWTLTEQESSLMWAAYVPTGNGVAIASTLGGLRRGFLFDYRERVCIGIIKYEDYTNGWAMLQPSRRRGAGQYDYRNLCLTKWREYQEEKEIRLLVNGFLLGVNFSYGPGDLVPVVTENLVKGIILPPNASPYVRKQVSNLVHKHCNGISICESALAVDHYY